MRRAGESDSKENVTSESQADKAVLEKLSRFADYTTPEIKELLVYTEDKMRVNGSPP